MAERLELRNKYKNKNDETTKFSFYSRYNSRKRRSFNHRSSYNRNPKRNNYRRRNNNNNGYRRSNNHHRQRNYRNGRNNNNNNQQQVTCFRCLQPGHKASYCYELKCSACGKVGHLKVDCQRKN